MRTLWHAEVGAGFYLPRHRPLLRDRTVTVRAGGTVAAVDAVTGDARWAVDLHHPSDDGRWFLPTPRGLVTDVAHVEDGLTEVVGVEDGYAAWHRVLPVLDATSCAVVEGERLLVTGATPTGHALLLALDAGAGAGASAGAPDVATLPLPWLPLGLVTLGPGRLLAMHRFGAATPGLFEVDVATGRCTARADDDVWPLEASGDAVATVCAAAGGGHVLRVLDPVGLEARWSAPVSADCAALAGDVVVAGRGGPGDGGARVVAFAVRTGEVVWEAPVGDGPVFDVSGAAGVVVVTTGAGVVVLDARDGQVLDTGARACAPPHVGDGAVHLLRDDGLVAAAVP
ncbi:PQQ-binding-like beta-propeller repeat protein [Cellulomonas sp. H30R-01]|uniref:outer membrane protein assembly factor BamB family protein n=1 Tax=Cellulomonas sp. H30R-01 TaxID=2704467 RepID=UPI00138BC4F2|nr:PQQ-binding-like beta-propeller repeat protein [Cellulomonas sp. H30R-01]QHT57418.1 PQQ-binding-like beta-propeller repeat protein [Cellulomonas sp. H30R-01]